MQTAVTSQQIDAYQHEGWRIIEDFLTPNELQEMCAAVHEAVERMGRHRIASGGKGNKALAKGVNDYYDRVFLQRVNLWKIDDTIKKYFLSAKLGEMLCKLAGINGIRV